MSKDFRFFDSRQKYLLFVTTTNEKIKIAEKISSLVKNINPKIINSIENFPLLTVHDFDFSEINKTANVINPKEVRKLPILPKTSKKGNLDAAFDKEGHSGDKLGWKEYNNANIPARAIPIEIPSTNPGRPFIFFFSFIRK